MCSIQNSLVLLVSGDAHYVNDCLLILFVVVVTATPRKPFMLFSDTLCKFTGTSVSAASHIWFSIPVDGKIYFNSGVILDFTCGKAVSALRMVACLFRFSSCYIAVIVLTKSLNKLCIQFL